MSNGINLIIAVYNRPDFLRKLFLSLLNQSHRDFEIVVADDGSNDAIAKVISDFSRSFEHPIQHVRHEDNGFRKTIIANKAVAQSGNDYLIFVDGDVLLHHNFVHNHYKHKKPGTVLVGRRVMFDRVLAERITAEDIISRRFQKYAFWKDNCDRKSKRRGFVVPFSFEIENLFIRNSSILGSNFSVHRDDFLSVNGYDEEIIGRGIEDDNLTARMMLRGIRHMKMTRVAIQYHLYHSSDPVPHSAEAVDRYWHPANCWARNGLIKGPPAG